MPRNVRCPIKDCNRWITNKRLDKGFTMCSVHQRKLKEILGRMEKRLKEEAK